MRGILVARKNKAATQDETVDRKRGRDVLNPATRSNHSFLTGSENALRQTSLWMMLATLAPPDSGSFQVKASGIDPFFLAIKSFKASSMLGSRYGAS